LYPVGVVVIATLVPIGLYIACIAQFPFQRAVVIVFEVQPDQSEAPHVLLESETLQFGFVEDTFPRVSVTLDGTQTWFTLPGRRASAGRIQLALLHESWSITTLVEDGAGTVRTGTWRLPADVGIDELLARQHMSHRDAAKERLLASGRFTPADPDRVQMLLSSAVGVLRANGKPYAELVATGRTEHRAWHPGGFIAIVIMISALPLISKLIDKSPSRLRKD
jgi:hypothetical protein